MLKNNSYALLIGVDDYSAYDASAGQPKGTSDLPGASNDVAAFFRTCLLLGVKPEHIWVLAAPLEKGGLLAIDGAPHVARAIKDEILDKIAWLSKSMAESDATGLLFYSGHSDWLGESGQGDSLKEEGLVLCPSDVVVAGKDHLKNAIPFAALRRIVDEHGVASNLTVVLDTCHAGTGEADKEVAKGADKKPDGNAEKDRREDAWKRVSLRGRSIPAELVDQPVVEISDRVVAACRRDEFSYQSRFSGVYRGAFSWAVGAVLEQWQAVQDGPHNVRLDLSYGELVSRARRLLEDLSFSQTPELHGAPELSSLALFQKGLEVEEGSTKKEPDSAFKLRQLDPGNKDYTLYTMVLPTGIIFARILVAKTTYTTGLTTYTAGKEYWSMIAEDPGTDTVTVTEVSDYWPGSGPVSNFPLSGALPTFNMPAGVSWRGTLTTPSGVSVSSTTLKKVCIQWNLTYSAGWSGNLTWFQSVASGGSPTAYVLSGGATLTWSSGSVSPPTGQTWYNVVVTPSP